MTDGTGKSADLDANRDVTVRNSSAVGRLDDDCFRPDQPLLTHARAVDILKARLLPITVVETVALGPALVGRTLARPVVAAHPVPGHTNAAVDGYAFRSSPDIVTAGATLAVAGRAAAGRPLEGSADPSAAVRIFTGAAIPPGTDTVVMQEHVRVDGDTVAIPAGLKIGANVRKAGEDLPAGRTVADAGHIVRPQDLAAFASVGASEIACFARVRVGIVSTGDEIIRPGATPLAPGQVYDANADMLAALVALAGADATTLGIWPDRFDIVTDNLTAAAERFDVLLTSGGASMGEEDHLATALAARGSRHLWQLAIKPGRPMMLGQIRSGDRDVIVVGLPGNPVAVFVCFLLYVFPLLRVAGGGSWPEPRRLKLPATFAFTGRKRGRREFWRATIVERDGALAVEKFARDGSGLISGLRAADCLIDIPEDHGDVAAGDLVDVIPLDQFGIRAN